MAHKLQFFKVHQHFNCCYSNKQRDDELRRSNIDSTPFIPQPMSQYRKNLHFPHVFKPHALYEVYCADQSSFVAVTKKEL